MVEVREAGPDDWREVRDIRLSALRDDPHAFASTFARENVFTEADWRRWIDGAGVFLAHPPGPSTSPRAAGATGPARATGPAEASGPARATGLAAGYEPAPGLVELVSMWVRPRARGQAVGEALVAAAAEWARARGAERVHLWVTETNKPARRLYERCGFIPTGERQPLPSDPERPETGMALPL
jgi:GNAT superfamily N-acetyltransferase